MKSDFFKIDTPEKYYILGLLYSDGYLGENSSNHKEYVGLKLIDKQILDDISKVTGCKEPFKAGITSAGNQLYRIEFRDSEVISDLKSIGLHRRKTFTITYPNIPEEYHRDFIRGVFDGDGCIHFALKKGRYNSYVTNFQIVGTFNLLDGISEHIGVNARIVPYRKVAKLLVDKKSDVISIYNYLYHDEDCLCLQRKHRHFNECVSTIYDSQERQKTYIKKKQEPRMTKDEFVMRAKAVHGDKYDYTKTIYKNNKFKITVICPIHGEFEQTPLNHLRGSGCRKCGFDLVHDKNRVLVDDFIKKAKEVHGDKYDYSKVVYKSSRENVCIICPEHGEFWQTPSNHLCGRGCRKCGLIRRSAERRKKSVDDVVNKNITNDGDNIK